MSKTTYQAILTATIHDSDRLPAGTTQQAAWASLWDALNAAIRGWHEANPGLLACDPDLL